MNASALFKAGKLQEAIAAQTQQVRDDPADQSKRLFLFELLAFAGDLDRARRQIDALNYEEPDLQMAALGYRQLLDSEQARRQVFREKVTPRFVGQPGDHVLLRLDALQRLQDNRPAEAVEVLARADEAVPPMKGMLNDKPFESLRDCDDLFGPVLEVMAQGSYFWVPLEQVATLAMNPPKYPRDLLWFPARLAMRDGPTAEVFVPVVYPGAHEQDNEAIKLGRLTDWKTVEGGPVLGIGQHMFQAGDEDVSLLQWRQLQML
jgi:type VI secretion system protein ImpE